MSSDKYNHPDSTQNSSFYIICRNFAMQSSAHGLRRAASARSVYTRIFWITVFVMALICCTFHCSFLVKNFLSYPRMTITEEIHADEIGFPSITVCNLNIFKKSYIDQQFEKLRQMTQSPPANNSMNPSEIDPTAFCYKSIYEFLQGSKTMDLSDIWMSLTVTKDGLLKYGHQEEDIITHCTYNARNCHNKTYSIVDLNAYPSPRYGLCHTISVKQLSLQNVTTPGLALGLRLTLNIQRDEYFNLLSPEYGARLLVHPAGTYPTLQRGGVVLQPGTKTYVSVRMRKIDRLPWPYGECTYEFEQSPLAYHLRKTGQHELLKHRIYTYEYCQTLCRDAYLLKQCDCSEEISQGNSKFCDPCNITQANCRTRFLKGFNRNPNYRECNRFCKPACSDIRYDLTVSRSEWPNSQHQYYILKRWPKLKEKFGPGAEESNNSDQNEDLNPTHLKFIKSNFLRVHVFIQEMNYLSVKDVPAYSEILIDQFGGEKIHDDVPNCRTRFLKGFNRNPNYRECNRFCKPACSDIRYDLTVSRSEWPNSQHQYYILKRWPKLKEKFGPGAEESNNSDQNEDLNPTHLKFIKSNFLRVHVFIQEMNYLSVKDVPAYSTSQLFADLGGCLGLYIGVSLLTILEVFELFKSIFFIIRRKIFAKMKPKAPKRSSHIGLHWAASRSQKYQPRNRQDGPTTNKGKLQHE
ncbi:Acid-sensing ion channel 4 [Araneus ventricosus]|uniref:Acid-sensing ion channel 4 n=1 Tax=Araneus ventricosus TaxID=182803 RepID=A0A4Y2BKM1_ARAVE|nr:Acid-sensing ion channel 4 [Araneus ventricosus]